MNKKQFIHEFEKNLKGVSREDKKEIIQDYEEHFAIGKKKGRKEERVGLEGFEMRLVDHEEK